MTDELELDIALEADAADDVAAPPAAPAAALDVSLEEDRYSRLRLIPWWDQELLHRARVLVVGAGALGN